MRAADGAEFPDHETLNQMAVPAFADAMARLFEDTPRFSVRLAAGRPYGTDADLLEGAQRLAASLPDAEAVELINAHPRLATAVHLSDASRREQGSADVAADRELADLQDAYEARFGFRYLVFVAGRPRAALLPDLRRSLGATREAERQRALNDTLAIAADRLTRLRRGGG